MLIKPGTIEIRQCQWEASVKNLLSYPYKCRGWSWKFKSVLLRRRRFANWNFCIWTTSPDGIVSPSKIHPRLSSAKFTSRKRRIDAWPVEFTVLPRENRDNFRSRKQPTDRSIVYELARALFWKTIINRTVENHRPLTRESKTSGTPRDL